MASKTIKGLTVEIGGDTTKLGKALDGVEKQSRSLSSELGQINKLLKLDPGNTELLAQKQRVLAEAVATTSKKLDTLKEAERQVQAQFERGEASEEQVRALQREIIETTNKLGKYEQAVKETADQIEELGKDTSDAAQDVNKLGDEADKAEKSADDLGGTLDGSLSTGLKAVAGLAAAAAAAIVGAVEATHEYRTAMGKLTTAFEDADHSSEAATKTYKELQSILGDTDQAVEAASHLALLCYNEEQLAEVTHAMTGVYAKMGASLPLEGLAEAINETAKVGKVTGSFADVINWAASEGADWNAVLGGNKKALTAFNKTTKEGEALEDAFSAALAACSDEQERQEILIGTLTRLYGKAGTEYKKTNKAVIEANKANEEWTATLAEVADEVQPVVTEVKKMGVEVLKNAKEPLSDVAETISDDVIPMLTSMSTWALNNGAMIKNTILTAAAAWVTYQAATVAATVAEKGLKDAIMSTTAAQKALNLVMNSNPYVLLATAIAAVGVALVGAAIESEKAKLAFTNLNAEEQKVAESARDAAEALESQRQASAEAAEGSLSEMTHVKNLAAELQTLADKSGKVKEQDEARAQFILGQLNDALGTEYTMVDGMIQKYDALTQSVEAAINAKTADLLLADYQQQYVESKKAELDLWEALTLANKDYEEQLKNIAATKEEKAALEEEIWKKLSDSTYIYTEAEINEDQRRLIALDERLHDETDILSNLNTKRQDAADEYNKASNDIIKYEQAQTAALQGNYDSAIEILAGKKEAYGDWVGKVDDDTAKVLSTLQKEAVDAGKKAEFFRSQWENGVDGFTEEMVTDAEKDYADTLSKFETAYADALAVGEDLGGGLSGGMENKRSSLMEKARSLVQSIIGAFRKEADSHSPSHKMVDFGEDMGEGGEIGLENKTDDMLDVAERQVKGLLDVYAEAGGTDGQSVFRAVQEQNDARRTTSLQTSTSTTANRLDRILEAIKDGQLIVLDGDKVVGGTASRMNGALGDIQLLTERGAIR